MRKHFLHLGLLLFTSGTVLGDPAPSVVPQKPADPSGVVFHFASNSDGELKWSSDIIPTKAQSGANNRPSRKITDEQMRVLTGLLRAQPKGKILILWTPEAPLVDSDLPPLQEPHALGLQLQEVLKQSGYDVSMNPAAGSPPSGVALKMRTPKANPIGNLIKDSMAAFPPP